MKDMLKFEVSYSSMCQEHGHSLYSNECDDKHKLKLKSPKPNMGWDQHEMGTCSN
jgi:hypothetical protein